MDHQIEAAPSTDNRRLVGGSSRRKLLAAGFLCCVGAAASLYAEIYVKESISDSSTPSRQSLNNDNDAALSSVVDGYFSGGVVDYNTSNEPNIEESRRQLSIALENGGCQVTYAQLAQVDIAPTWQASFPGSGARMTWSLVEALTGIRTNDDYNSHERGYDRVVAVKTHYPVKNSLFEELDYKFGRAIVILRDPSSAIPSYFNLQYEHRYGLPNHSTRGPNEDWLEYRDHPNYGLTAQLLGPRGYEKFVEHWMNKYEDRSNLLMVSYEDLIDNDMGPIVTTRIAHFLGQNEGVEPIADESIPCVWETIVNYKNHPPPTEEELTHGTNVSAKRKAATRKNGRKLMGIETAKDGTTFVDPSSLRTGPKIRPYTEENLANMVDMYQRLAAKYSYDEDLVRIMSMYAEHAKNYENPPEQ